MIVGSLEKLKVKAKVLKMTIIRKSLSSLGICREIMSISYAPFNLEDKNHNLLTKHLQQQTSNIIFNETPFLFVNLFG